MILKEFARIPDKWLGDVEALLALCDKEFYRPLSSRGSTTQADLQSAQNVSEGVKDYFREIARQHAVLVLEETTGEDIPFAVETIKTIWESI